MKELHAIFKGRVQGVGFRWTVVDHAEKFHLSGTVKNLSDGSVEVYAQGTQEALQSFLDAVTKDPGSARIDSVKTRYQEPQNTHSDFRIVH